MTLRANWILGLAGLMILGLASGCGTSAKSAVVEGTVTMDNQPVDQAVVLFSSPGHPATTAMTDAKGKFRIELPLGATNVGVAKTTTAAPKGKVADEETNAGQTVWATPARYADPQQSGLSIEVKTGMQPVTLTLASSKAR